MTVSPVGRRGFLGAAGGALFCTLNGHHLSSDSHVNIERLAADIPLPPSLQGGGQPAQSPSQSYGGGPTREYWIRAERVRWNIVPSHHDGMMNMRVRGRTKFTALAYRGYSRGFGRPLGPASIPGPLIEAQTGDTVIINFENAVGVPVTMHPHGIYYPSNMDGAYKGAYTQPGGFVRPGHRFQYVWHARPGTEGAWLYHDHGPLDPLPLFKGLFGPLIVRKAGAPRPAREFFLALHSFSPLVTNLRENFACINGRAYAGNTPTLRAKVGDSVAFHVFALDNDFHTFHVHGHRWSDPDGGQVIDNKVLGPADSITAQFVEDNPGRWFYHCHVFNHLHMGMTGWYIVD